MGAQFIATSRLGNIIQMITLARTSGVLRALRGQGPLREAGEIRFIDGEPVSAQLGHMTGAGALNVLMNWGECLYAFDEAGRTEAPGTGPLYHNDGQGGSARSSTTSSTSYSTGSWPGYGSDSPGSGSLGQRPQAPFTSGRTTSASLGYIPQSHWPQSPMPQSPMPQSPMPQSPMPQTPWPASQSSQSPLPTGQSAPYPNAGSAPRYDPNERQQVSRPLPVSPGAPVRSNPAARQLPVSPDMLRAIPQRTMSAEEIEHLPLDRNERMLLLLMDGQRSMADISRLTRLSEQDLYAQLSHLNLLGLIRLQS